MIIFPNCKINLGLRILGKRSDGFHNIETAFYPLQIKDALELIAESSQSPSAPVQLSLSGILPEIPEEENICVKAYHLLKKDFPRITPVKMHLHKIIPAGAGLGGGSADGAFTLKLINEKFNLGLNNEQLLRYALQLGSDCPFFILNIPCIATGRGEVMAPLERNLGDYKFVLINPGIHVNTAWAYAQVSPTLPVRSIKEILLQPVETWKDELVNDFEAPVFKNFPEIKSIKENLYNSNSLFASMSGSGSTVFGIFKKDMETRFSFPAHYFTKELSGKLN
ncbi:MAG: 4-(cytidine 5'-diphospho)-2-C-methyl-D-erythritol kinase [Chitinophagaceae bacterium]|nr:4-(cytidine 5'-diphospho)-2-C-methyl-D-erythritol kinase [Chitinophagaceae bacterium]